MTSILAFYSYHNQVPQTRWLTPEETLSHGSGSYRSEISILAGPHSLSNLEGRILPCLFQILVAPGILWFVAASLQSASEQFGLVCLD